jgi:hypothetical protein
MRKCPAPAASTCHPPVLDLLTRVRTASSSLLPSAQAAVTSNDDPRSLNPQLVEALNEYVLAVDAAAGACSADPTAHSCRDAVAQVQTYGDQLDVMAQTWLASIDASASTI